MLDDK